MANSNESEFARTVRILRESLYGHIPEPTESDDYAMHVGRLQQQYVCQEMVFRILENLKQTQHNGLVHEDPTTDTDEDMPELVAPDDQMGRSIG